MLLVLGSLLAAVSRAGQTSPAANKPKEDVYELQKLLVDTLDQVERSYVKDISRREIVEAAIRGLLKELDPYSDYISPEEMKQFQSTVDAQFGGIGIQVSIDEGQLRVLSPMVGTPAYRAGLIAGDQIVEIEGKTTANISMDEAVRQLKGEPGSKVTLTVIHSGKTARETVTLTREVIHIETVLGDHRKPDDSWDFLLDKAKGLGYVRITSFSRDTATELEAALNELKQQNLRALILDLRFNPGGLLTAAIEVSDLFVANGRIVSTKGRNSEERVWEAHKEGTFEGFPIVILVNRFTASASEIVSACLQDHHRAVVMGERTWGKGSVQNVIPLEEQRSALKLTTASYRRPSGKNIHRFPNAKESEEWGVMPDKGYDLKLDDGELFALMEDRRQRDIVQPKPQAAGATVAKNEAPGAAAGTQPAQENAGKTAAPAKPEAPAATKPTEPAKEPGAPRAASSADKPTVYVDAQLRMAVDYLTTELAKAK
jgi:carboxyl-terminal processing protease